MERETGKYEYPLWILGDSEPLRWKDKLDLPFDDRHPIVHNIWTSIIDKIQEKIYKSHQSRIDSSKIFVRNAVTDPVIKAHAIKVDWEQSPDLWKELSVYQNLIIKYKPKLIFSFGAFAFEFGRRSL
jgi:hypothetical protein